MTLRKIAKRTGVSLGTVHYYFGDKEKVLEAVFDKSFAAFYEARDDLIHALRQSDNPGEVMEAAVRRGFRLAVRLRASVRLTQIIALDRGFLPERRRAEEDLFLGAVSGLGQPPIQTKLLLKSMIFCAVRYATLGEDELRRVAGIDDSVDTEHVYALVEDHLVRLLLGFMAYPTEKM